MMQNDKRKVVLKKCLCFIGSEVVLTSVSQTCCLCPVECNFIDRRGKNSVVHRCRHGCLKNKNNSGHQRLCWDLKAE